ncbi:MAG: hypothetical protein IPM34_04905 [Saprospiraceae bacterium]|nr:hypothetical protein [Saprospiraceae bacterium]
MVQKENFFKNEYIPILQNLDSQAMGNWGKMNVHQMIEHMSDAFRNGNGKDVYSGILSQEERLPKMQAFLLSDQPFKENTKNILMGEDPLPGRHPLVSDSLAELKSEIDHFFTYWDQHRGEILRNPFFGDLDYEHWVALLYKHAKHHLLQFGVVI